MCPAPGPGVPVPAPGPVDVVVVNPAAKALPVKLMGSAKAILLEDAEKRWFLTASVVPGVDGQTKMELSNARNAVVDMLAASDLGTEGVLTLRAMNPAHVNQVPAGWTCGGSGSGIFEEVTLSVPFRNGAIPPTAVVIPLAAAPHFGETTIEIKISPPVAGPAVCLVGRYTD